MTDALVMLSRRDDGRLHALLKLHHLVDDKMHARSCD
jgi:hypothetical protein